MESTADLKAYYKLLSKLNVPFLTTQNYKTGSLKRNRRYQISIYGKAAEIEVHNPSSLAEICRSIKSIHRIIRIEERLYSKKLFDLFGYNRLVKYIVQENVSKFVIDKTVDRMGLQYKFLTKAEMTKYIAKYYTKSINLQKFITDLNSQKWEKVKETYGSSTFYFYIKKIHNDDLSPFYLDKKVGRKIDFKSYQYKSRFKIIRQLRRMLQASVPPKICFFYIKLKVNKFLNYIITKWSSKPLILHCRSPTL